MSLDANVTLEKVVILNVTSEDDSGESILQNVIHSR